MFSCRSLPAWVIIVVLPGSLWGCDSAGSSGQDPLTAVPSWGVQEELRIGREDNPDYALVPVGGIGVTDEGSILVSQPQEGAIRVFDDEGRFLRRIGRPGDGPGEFGRLGPVGVLGDTIWAVDCRGACFLQFFDGEGRWIDRLQVPRIEPPFSGANRYYPLPDGGVVAPSAAAGEMMQEAHEAPWFRWNADGTGQLRLPGYLSPGILIIENRIIRPDGRTVDSPVGTTHPFSEFSWMGIAPDHSCLVRAESIPKDSDEWTDLRLLRFTPDGDTVASGKVSLRPRPIPPEVADSALDAQIARLAGPLQGEERARRELTARVSVPEHYPPVRSLVVSPEGRTWIALNGAGETRWLILDSSFEPVAAVDVPSRFEPAVVDGDVLWGVEFDEFDVPQVVRYRVVR